MKIFFDTEFIDEKDYLSLLSIGLVREDGATYYAELDSTDRSKADFWVKINVLPLMGGPIKSRDQMAYEIAQFVGEKPEFWAYFGAFDWVLLSRLYGKMICVPKGWEMRYHEILDLRPDLKGRMWTKQTTVEHYALNDAIYNKELYEWLMKQPKNESIQTTTQILIP